MARAKRKINPFGLPSYQVALSVQAFYNEIDEIFEKTRKLSTARLRYEIKSRYKIASGYLLANSRYVYTREGKTFMLNLVAPPYWEEVNLGRPPGTKVPISDIKKWMREKRVKFKERPKRHDPSVRKGMKFMKRTEQGGWKFMSDDEAAEIIQQKIFKKGTKSSKYVFHGIRRGAQLSGKYLKEPQFLFNKVDAQTKLEFQKKLKKIDTSDLAKVGSKKRKYTIDVKKDELELLLEHVHHAMYLAFVKIASTHYSGGDIGLDNTPLSRQKTLLQGSGEEDIYTIQDAKDDIKEKHAMGKTILTAVDVAYVIPADQLDNYKKASINEIAIVLNKFGRFGRAGKILQTKSIRTQIRKIAEDNLRFLEKEVTKGNYQRLMRGPDLKKVVHKAIKDYVWDPKYTLRKDNPPQEYLKLLKMVSTKARKLGIQVTTTDLNKILRELKIKGI